MTKRWVAHYDMVRCIGADEKKRAESRNGISLLVSLVQDDVTNAKLTCERAWTSGTADS